MNIGIYTVNSQSGRAFFCDFISQGHYVMGCVRQSPSGDNFQKTIKEQKGIYLQRPEDNKNGESSKYLSLQGNYLGEDLEFVVANSDFLIIAQPTHYLNDTISALIHAGITKRRIPLILSPSRTFATPYIWNQLGMGYPVICFSTCPYSVKAFDDSSVYIKRRKRTWTASFEGEFIDAQIANFCKLFPQAVLSTIPASTSLGNIGAIFHPAGYLLNYESIKECELTKKSYSFYMQGIAHNTAVANEIEKIDQIRLNIADHLGFSTFGLIDNPRENEWILLMTRLREKEKIEAKNDITMLRKIRHDMLANTINKSIVSAAHWLDYTYGVSRIAGESLANTIGRTPTYQKKSVPQKRYYEEDVPTGVIPLYHMALRFDIPSEPLKDIIFLYEKYCGNKNCSWRDLNEFSDNFIKDYLSGNFFIRKR